MPSGIGGLQPGDVVADAVEGVGALTNTAVEGE